MLEHKIMKVEIWSDVVCPFCYIGKRKFESALAQFNQRDQVEVIWKSFQLDPNAKYKEGVTLYKSLAESKGWTEDYTKQVTEQVIGMARAEGLEFDFDHMIPANTFDAHRLIHLAAAHQLQDQAKEILLKAYFTDGKNLEDHQTLLRLGTKIGLSADDINDLLKSEKYTNDVEADIADARRMGANGVPFFVFDGKFAVSGAQPVEVFLKALEKAAPNVAAENKTSCAVDEKC
jgi:predicted DsbA family dithiol-disulfide isomerase